MNEQELKIFCKQFYKMGYLQKTCDEFDGKLRIPEELFEAYWKKMVENVDKKTKEEKQETLYDFTRERGRH